MEDGYCVKWEKHHNAVFSVLDNLYQSNIMVDCTLAAEDKFIKAHRIVLMSCSPYFEELLSQHSDSYPIVWLNMRYIELQALIDFCYRGEVRLPQSDLPGFLNAGRLLQIKGLCLVGNEVKRKNEDDSPPPKKRHHADEGINEELFADDDYTYLRNEGDQNGGDLINHSSSRVIGDSDYSDVDTDDESSSGEGEGAILLEEVVKGNSTHYVYRWSCNRCGNAFPTRLIYSEHRRTCYEKKEDHTMACHKCPMTYKNKKDLTRHLQDCGIETERHICERCGKTYKFGRGLKRHKIYCGTDVQPMVCDKCGKTYKYKRGLRRHQRQQCELAKTAPVKAVVLETPIPPKKPEPELSSPSTPMEQTCPSCGKLYKYRKSFNSHVKTCKGVVPESSSLLKQVLDHRAEPSSVILDEQPSVALDEQPSVVLDEQPSLVLDEQPSQPEPSDQQDPEPPLAEEKEPTEESPKDLVPESLKSKIDPEAMDTTEAELVSMDTPVVES